VSINVVFARDVVSINGQSFART